MAGAVCGAVVQACAMRVARLDAAGATPAGAANMYVTDQLVEFRASDEIEAGDEITVKNACGKPVVVLKDSDKAKWMNVTIDVATPDAELSELLYGALLILATGNTVGVASPKLNEPVPGNGVSVELFSKNWVNGALHATRPYVRTLWPKVYNLRRQEQTYANANTNLVVAGQATENAGITNGPTNDWTGPADRVWASMEVAGPLPTTQCGYVATPAQT